MQGDERRFVRLRLADVVVGEPLPFTLYDEEKTAIRLRGDTIVSQAALGQLFSQNVYRLEQEPALRDGLGVMLSRQPSADKARAKTAPARGAEMAFDSSGIRVGDPIQLQSTPAAPRYTSLLIGYLKNRSVIVTQPEIDGELAMLREGQAFSARFFSGRSVFEFPTSVLKQTNVPYPLLHLAYPRDLKVQEIRRAPRVAVDVIVAVETPGGESHSGKLLDLSTAGAGLGARKRFADKGDVLRLKFKLAVQGIDTYIVATAEVRNVVHRVDHAQTPYLYGLHFVDLEEGTLLVLAAYVFGAIIGEHTGH